MIKIDNLSISYGPKEVFNNFSLNLSKNQIVGLVGPNGSGKTTLLKILAGLETTYTGDLMVNNIKLPNNMAKSFISFQPDHLFFDDRYKLSDIEKLYAYFFCDFDCRKFENMIKEFGLNLNMNLKQMSKGMKDKVQIALTLSRKAKIYLLDEPLNGLDPAARKKILDIMIDNFDENGLTIISTHLISQIERILDRAIVINNGKVLLNERIDEFREKNKISLEEYFEEVF